MVVDSKRNEKKKMTTCVTICIDLCRPEEKSGTSNGSEEGINLQKLQSQTSSFI